MRLRYWLKEAFDLTGRIFLMVIVYFTIVFTLVFGPNTDDAGLEVAAEALSVILLGGCALMLFVMETNLHTLYVPVTLSFGSTRREALAGVHCYRLIPIVLTTLVAQLIFLFAKSGFSVLLFGIAGIGVCLFCAAMGTLLGIAYARFGKTVSIVFMLIGMIGPAVLVGLLIALAESEIVVLRPMGLSVLMWIVLAVGVAAYIGSALIEGRFIRKYCVKL